jgi:type II secretory pathway pseudopilin PulG
METVGVLVVVGALEVFVAVWFQARRRRAEEEREERRRMKVRDRAWREVFARLEKRRAENLTKFVHVDRLV